MNRPLRYHIFRALPLCLVLAGCGAREAAVSTDATPESTSQSTSEVAAVAPVRFTDVTQQAGLQFMHNNGAFGAALLPETMGSGCVFFDYDSDGDADIFLVNGRNWTAAEAKAYDKSPVGQEEMEFLIAKARREGNTTIRRSPPNKPYKKTVGKLYRNRGDGTFTDATKGSGLDLEMLGMGAAAGDYDADGKLDLCVTSYGRLYLFRNLGNGRFREVAARVGLKDDQWSTAAAWFDYDRDGKLDLFVGRYLTWTPATDFFTSLDSRSKSYGWPLTYPSETSLLFRNTGDGFEDVSNKAGIARRLNAVTGKDGKIGSPLEGAALGVVVCDPNDDGWPDLIVANDLRANFFFVNRKNGTFHEVAVKSNIALSKAGKARGGMGIDAADIDHSGRSSVAIGHFNADIMGLWQDSGGGAFTDIAEETAVGPASSTFLTFGLLFADFNNDGWPDLLAANGHVDPTVHNYLLLVTYPERPLLFLNETASSPLRRPQFREIAVEAGLDKAIVARGLAVADIDLDGDLDTLMTINGGAPILLRNESENNHHALRLVLRGDAPNLNALGARIEARVGGEVLHRDVRTGSSYLSQNELPLTLGLGTARQIDALDIHWPNGKSAHFENLAADQTVIISQSKGIVARRPLARP